MNETSTQRRAEPRSRANRGHDGRHALRPPEQAGVVRSSPGKVWGLVGLVVLTAVTSLVVATISVWLTPVYMTAMVLIFAAPRSPRPPAAATTPGEAPAAPSENAAPLPGNDVPATLAEAAEAVVDPPSAADPAGPATAKPRKRRAKAKRAGKAAKGAKGAGAETPASEPTWIRVGPGKFVRADDVQATPSETETETQTQTEPTTPTAADLPIEPEATPAADVEPVAEAGNVEPMTPEDESRPTEPDEEYGIAPSALAGDFDEEYGIAPSALAETWTPEALPEAVAADAPEPVATPIEAEPVAEDEDRSQARSEVEDEVEDEVEVEVEVEATPAPVALPAMVGSSRSERPAPGAMTTGPGGVARARGLNLGLVRRAVSRIRERFDRPGPPRRGDAVARPTRSGRADHVRARRTERGRLRFDPTGRRHHPRSPPRRGRG